MANEADIHFELYRHLMNSIEEKSSFDAIEYGKVKPEVSVGGGFADLVVYDAATDPVVVIEAKRPGTEKIPDRDIDPYSPKVARQAMRYAGEIGARYFATYNGTHCVVYRTFEKGKELLERRTHGYRVNDVKKFSSSLLSEIDGLDTGRVEWDPHHEAFINRLRVYHQRLTEEWVELLPDHLQGDKNAERFEEWIKEQGWSSLYESYKEDVYKRYASQAAYMLMNKLVFYKLLEDNSSYNVPHVSMRDLVNPEARRRAFDDLIEALDFEAVYTQDPIFDMLPLTERAKRESDELLLQLERFNLNSFDHDVIGQIYQRIIPPEERHELGQYYTPPEIVELICNLTIESADDVVFDPACGSGGFLVGAYKELKKLNPTSTHQDTLNQIKGVDINRFPAHLSAINLALQDLDSETKNVDVEIEDFFLIEASQGRIQFKSKASVRGSGEDMETGGFDRVDALVGNPPYIRQEQIKSKRRCRKHLDKVGVDLGRRSDIYSYFFTHGFEFLKPGARVGFITSDRWLSVKYGEKLQDFILDHFRIKAIINFSKQQFELALISTCVVILEHCRDPEERHENIVSMIQLRGRTDIQNVIQLVNEQSAPNKLVDKKEYRKVALRQKDLHGVRKWNRFLNGPSVYWSIMQLPSITKLGDIGKIRRGKTTGANAFFYFKERSDWEAEGIDERFVRPLLKHGSEMDGIELRSKDLEWWVLDVHDFIVEEVDGNDQWEGDTDSERAKHALRSKEYSSLVDYIDRGEQKGYHERASVETRRIWFDLGDLPTPPMALIEVYWRDCQTVYNTAEAAFDKRLYCLYGNDDVDDMVLAGILNTSLYAMIRELHGRTEQGQGMDRNTVMVYEARQLPIPDPRSFDERKASTIKECFSRLLEEERTAIPDQLAKLKNALDAAVMDAIGMKDRKDDVQQAAAALLRMREEGAGMYTDVQVESEQIEQTLTGAVRVDGGPGSQLSMDM